MALELWRTRPTTSTPWTDAVDRLFDAYYTNQRANGGSTGYQSLPVNVWETPDGYQAALLAPGLDGANGGHHEQTQPVRAHTRREGNQLRGTGQEQRQTPPRGSRCVRGCGEARLARAVGRCAIHSHQETAVCESKIMNIADQASRLTWLDSRPRWHPCQEQDVPVNQPDPSRASSRRGVLPPAGTAPLELRCARP